MRRFYNLFEAHKQKYVVFFFVVLSMEKVHAGERSCTWSVTRFRIAIEKRIFRLLCAVCHGHLGDAPIIDLTRTVRDVH